jgi:large subunit ribosomal protein L31
LTLGQKKPISPLALGSEKCYHQSFEIEEFVRGIMKADIHPEFREVIFKDISCDYELKTWSTARAKETVKWSDGKEYPLIKVDISSASHPFYTGQQRLIDTEGRAEKYRKKYGARPAKK